MAEGGNKLRQKILNIINKLWKNEDSEWMGEDTNSTLYAEEKEKDINVKITEAYS